MSKADSGHIMPNECSKPSRRSALSMMTATIPLIAAAPAIAAPPPNATPLFLEIVAAYRPVRAALHEWGDCVGGTPEFAAAEKRSNAADEIYYGLIRRYVAEANSEPSWHRVGELAAIYRHEWWDEEGRIGEPTDPWLERALLDLIAKLSGVSDRAFKGGIDA